MTNHSQEGGQRMRRIVSHPGVRIIRNIVIVLLCLGGATLVTELFYDLALGPQNAILLFVLAIFIISVLTDGYIYCITAALAGVVIFDYRITAPRLGFSFTHGFPATMVIMLLVALMTSYVTARIRVLKEIAVANERRAELLYQINERLLSAGEVASIAGEANAFIARYLGRSSCIYFLESCPSIDAGSIFPSAVPGDLDAGAFLAADVCRELGASFQPGQMTTTQTAPLVLFPLPDESMPCILAISCQAGPFAEEDRHFTEMLVRQLAHVLHVETLRQQRQQAEISAETEKSRNKFLRAISHDLRTPLTSMLGASTILMEGNENLDPQVRVKLAENIHEDSAWLLDMVQNILSTTRMQAKGIALSRQVEAVEEVIAGAVGNVRKRFPGCSIQVDVPEQLVTAQMDAMLISQVVSNLIENAIRHAGKEHPLVQVGLSEADGNVWVTVSDDGAGLPDRVLTSLFEQQVVQDQGHETSRGFGMGLSICKAIIEAHQGTIEGSNRPQGGAVFRFSLPAEEFAQ